MGAPADECEAARPPATGPALRCPSRSGLLPWIPACRGARRHAPSCAFVKFFSELGTRAAYARSSNRRHKARKRGSGRRGKRATGRSPAMPPTWSGGTHKGAWNWKARLQEKGRNNGICRQSCCGSVALRAPIDIPARGLCERGTKGGQRSRKDGGGPHGGLQGGRGRGVPGEEGPLQPAGHVHRDPRRGRLPRHRKGQGREGEGR